MNPSKPILYFAHANGFPADCYQVFFAPFAAQYEVKYLPVLAMNPEYPVTSTWDLLVEEVIADITAQAKGCKVVGVGHSFGSLLLLMASYKRPELFEQVVLMDPPFLMGDLARVSVSCCCFALAASKGMSQRMWATKFGFKASSKKPAG